MPTDLAARYDATRNDPELVALRDELGLVDARIADLLGRLESGEAGSTWRDILDAIERRRKLAESEMKRLVAMQQMITAEQALTLIGVVVDVIRRHVTDRQAWSAGRASRGRSRTIEEGMMGVKRRRLDLLARAFGPASPPGCRWVGERCANYHTIRVGPADVDEPVPPPATCPVCGRPTFSRTYVLVAEDTDSPVIAEPQGSA